MGVLPVSTALPALTPERMQALTEQAHAGEPVRNDVLLSLQPRLSWMAWRYARVSRALPCAPIEAQDLLSEANLAILRAYDTALGKRELYPYLTRIAQLTMIDCIRGRRDLISTSIPEDRPCVLSLSAAIDEEGHTLADVLTVELRLPSALQRRERERVAALLEQAVAELPPKQRFVIERHYGLAGAPRSLHDLSRAGVPSTQYHHRKALAALRQVLAAALLVEGVALATRSPMIEREQDV